MPKRTQYPGLACLGKCFQLQLDNNVFTTCVQRFQLCHARHAAVHDIRATYDTEREPHLALCPVSQTLDALFHAPFKKKLAQVPTDPIMTQKASKDAFDNQRGSSRTRYIESSANQVSLQS